MPIKDSTITYFGQERSVSDWCKIKSLSKGTFFDRWRRMGKPKVVNSKQYMKLFREPHPIGYKPVRLVKLLPSGEMLTYKQLEKISEIKISTIMFKAAKAKWVLHEDDLKKKEARTYHYKDGPMVPADPEYLDPNYLPDIPWGDLAHLSNEENTGAGKGEIPDEDWFRMPRVRRRVTSSGRSISEKIKSKFIENGGGHQFDAR